VPSTAAKRAGLGADAPLDDLTALGEDVDLAVPLVHVDANMVHGWSLPFCGVDRGVLVWGSVCHHVKREASRFIPSILFPPCDRGHSAAREDTRELRDGALRPREVADAEVADDRVDGARVERQRLRGGFAELEPRMGARGEGDHPRREVGAHDALRSTGGCSRGDSARAGRDVENATARAHARGVEQRRDRASGHRLEEVMVAVGNPVVRGALEVPERFSIHGAPRA
jgi:hypothetical protein